ncbi:MAG: PIN domain-containing protein [Acidiferrobacterales bacterium]
MARRDQISEAYEVIPMDTPAFREWARLMEGKSDHLFEDAMIAATARIRRFTVATRNTRDFESLGVKLFNPFDWKTQSPPR